MSSQANIVGYCRVCGTALGEADSTAAEGALYCSEHAPVQPPPIAPAQELPADGTASPYSAPLFHSQGGSQGGANPPPLPRGDPHASPAIAFVLGMIPGVGAVYNGQYAKGLVHVVILGVIFSILGNGAARGFEPLFGVLIPCFWFYMCFEAYHTAKKRSDGEAVDEFSGLVHRNHPPSRFPVAPVLLIALGVLFLLDNLDLLKIGRLLRYWPALLIVFGLYMLYERLAEVRK